MAIDDGYSNTLPQHLIDWDRCALFRPKMEIGSGAGLATLHAVRHTMLLSLVRERECYSRASGWRLKHWSQTGSATAERHEAGRHRSSAQSKLTQEEPTTRHRPVSAWRAQKVTSGACCRRGCLMSGVAAPSKRAQRARLLESKQ